MKTQMQMFYAAARKHGERDRAFMELRNHPTNPLTAEDVRKLAVRWPTRYGRYAGFARP